jgi:hypothetical protein
MWDNAGMIWVGGRVVMGEVEVKCKIFTCHIPPTIKLKGKMQLKK